MGGSSPLASYEAAVERAEKSLKVALLNRDEAKKGINYKNAPKNIKYYGVKAMNSYDAKIYEARLNLKEAKARLAEAKKRYK